MSAIFNSAFAALAVFPINACHAPRSRFDYGRLRSIVLGVHRKLLDGVLPFCAQTTGLDDDNSNIPLCEHFRDEDLCGCLELLCYEIVHPRARGQQLHKSCSALHSGFPSTIVGELQIAAVAAVRRNAQNERAFPGGLMSLKIAEVFDHSAFA